MAPPPLCNEKINEASDGCIDFNQMAKKIDARVATAGKNGAS